MLRYGIEQCSNRDLLAIILRSGVKGQSVLELADQVLSMQQNLAMLTQLTYEELIQIRGIKKRKRLAFWHALNYLKESPANLSHLHLGLTILPVLPTG